MIPDLSKFIDIHSHILPGIDDGPKNMSESAEMARRYVDAGVTQIITTPHFIPGTAWAVERDQIIKKLIELSKYLHDEGINLQIFPGMEIAYHKKLIDRLKNGTLQSLANGPVYLLEPSFRDSAEDLLACVKKINQIGKKVIIAHPERIKTFQESLQPLLKQIKNGLRTQLNTGSILGKFGTASRDTAMLLIKSNTAHYLASDAHSANNRRPVDAEEWKDLSSILGPKLLTTLCIDNPKKLLSNSYDE